MYKTWEVVRACDFSTQKVEGEGSEVKGCLCLQRKLQATLNYMRQSQKEKQGRKEEEGRKVERLGGSTVEEHFPNI